MSHHPHHHPHSPLTTAANPLDYLLPNIEAYQPGKVWSHFLHFATGLWGDTAFLKAICDASNGAGLSLPAFYEYDRTIHANTSDLAGIFGFCCPESHEFGWVRITIVPDGNSASGWGTNIGVNGAALDQHHTGWVRVTHNTTLGPAYLHFAVGKDGNYPKLVVGWEKGDGDADEVTATSSRW